MSRVGRMPITMPQGVEVNFDQGGVTVKGPSGELHRSFNPDITIALEDNSLVVSRPSDSKEHRSLHGLTRSLLANMVEGVSRGFEKQLEIAGQLDFLKYPYHQAIIDNKIPLSIGGGIGQSRTQMVILKKAHIGEVSVSVWPKILYEMCRKRHIFILE